MIRHVVLFAWTAEATAAQVQRVADELRALPPLMRGLRSYQLAADAGLIDGNYDFAVVGDFDDAEATSLSACIQLTWPSPRRLSARSREPAWRCSTSSDRREPVCRGGQL